MPGEVWKQYSRHHTMGSQGHKPCSILHCFHFESECLCAAFPGAGKGGLGAREKSSPAVAVTPCQTAVPALLLRALGSGSSGAGCSAACTHKPAWVLRSPSAGGHSSEVQRGSGRAVLASCSAELPSCLRSPRQPFPSPGMGETPSEIPNPRMDCTLKPVKHNSTQKKQVKEEADGLVMG